MRKLILHFIFIAILFTESNAQIQCSGGGSPATVTFDLTGQSSYGDYGDALNYSTTLVASFPGDVVGLEYNDLDLVTEGASWCSEMVIDLSDEASAFSNYYSLNVSAFDDPSPCDDLPVSGFLDLASTGDEFFTGPGGEIYLELWDLFDDNADDIEATFLSGTITIYVCPAGQILPIKLKTFAAEAKGMGNVINWETSSEINNSHQIVEKSYSGLRDWEELGRISGTNTSTINKYTLKDDTPYLTTYYRLRSVDFDGAEQFSDVVYVKRSSIHQAGVKSIQVGNDGNRLKVAYNSDIEQAMKATIFDATGKLFLTENANILNGNNELDYDISSCPVGVYYLKTQTQEGFMLNKFIKI